MSDLRHEEPRFAVCINNRDYPASLELHKKYRVLPDEDAARDGDIRVVDESGEDYLYRAGDFVLTEVPAKVRNARRNMRHLTIQMVADVLNRMDPAFDAHAAEKRAIGMFPREVGREIADYTNSPRMTALQKFSMKYAQFIDQVFGSAATHPQIQKTSKIMSDNLAGDPTENQQWEKLETTITPPAATAGLDALLAQLNRDPAEEGE